MRRFDAADDGAVSSMAIATLTTRAEAMPRCFDWPPVAASLSAGTREPGAVASRQASRIASPVNAAAVSMGAPRQVVLAWRRRARRRFGVDMTPA